ncbi:hypothetical protein [Dactylosporangium sp. CA-092794]|uniref:hypothetical protein n=1 Tax=Dactylosporangium sp. CA-092794 TaxID=3239929 RepID=UPI003D9067E1
MRWSVDDRLTGLVEQYTGGLRLPPMRRARSLRASEEVPDVAEAVSAEVRRLLAGAGGDGGGAPIAVGVGSRGIAGIALIVRTVVAELAAAGFAPFVVPAMGSHGGATAPGQAEVLAGYGITEEYLGVPIRATMDTVVIGEVGGVPVHLDRNVAEAGRALLVARIKPHTDFHGPIESGAAKMAAIGLGKRAGAQAIHRLGVPGLRDVMPRIGRYIAARVLLGALTVVENEFDRTGVVRALRPEEIGAAGESELLELARAGLPRLPAGDLDVLVVDRMGKDVSGVGLDPNVTGRWLVNGVPEPPGRQIRSLAVLSLSEASHGNAIGVGLADFVPARLVEQVDVEQSYVNVLTAGWAGLGRGRLPMVLPTDRDAVTTAVMASGRHDRPRIVWIRDTLHTRVCAVSEALWPEIGADAELELFGPAFPLPFDDTGRLAGFTDAEDRHETYARTT